MRRRDDGVPLRAAMQAAGLSIPGLAQATRAKDPAGDGISRAMLGFLVSTGKSARQECSDRAARLIADTLGREVGDLFQDVAPMVAISTSTATSREEMQTTTSTTSEPEPLLTSRQLRKWLQKSESWLDGMIRDGIIQPIYAGRNRRFDRTTVLQELAAYRAAPRKEPVAA